MKYEPKQIFNFYDKWAQYMDSSWARGDDNLKFIEASEQYESQQGDFTQKKEEFVFNFSHKVLKTAQANGKEIDLSLSLHSVCNDDQEEEKASRAILQNAMLNGCSSRALAASLDKVYSYGQSVLYIMNERENEETLNQVLTIKHLENPKNAFFDLESKTPTFNDGKFCGMKYKTSTKILERDYQKLKGKLGKGDADVVDFWCKAHKRAKYIPLVNNSYKREDLIDPARDDINFGKEPKTGKRTFIKFLRVVRKGGEYYKLESQAYGELQDLPMFLNPGGMVWTGDQYESFPLGYHLRDAQTIMNYSVSVMADMMKTTNSDRWIFDQDHLDTEEARECAESINSVDGALRFGGDISKIRREPPQQIPGELVQIFTQMPMIMQQLAGSYFDEGSSKLKAMSGVALDKMFNRADLVQNPAIVAHLNTVNQIGEVFKRMIPIYYTEERAICYPNPSGETEEIIINQQSTAPDGSLYIKNDIRDLAKTYQYKVKASPSRRLQKQNTVTELERIYSIYPQAFQATADLYVLNLDIPDADIISKRLSTQIDPMLIAFSNGNVSRQEYDNYTQQKQQQAMQQQQQAMMNSPEAVYKQAKAESERSRAQSDAQRVQIEQANAETARMEAADKAHNDHVKNISTMLKTTAEDRNTQRQQKLEWHKTDLQHRNAIIENLSKLRQQ